ncbi:MAG: glycosyltransferase family 4 protein [Pseudomonadota bacterium]
MDAQTTKTEVTDPETARMIRVLFLNSSVSGGGAGKALIPLISALDPKRIESHVVIPFDGVVGDRLREIGAVLHYYPFMAERFGRAYLPVPRFLRFGNLERALNIALFPKIIFDLRPLVRGLEIDAIYANHQIHVPVAIGLGRLTGKPVILHSREVLTGFGGWLFRCLARSPAVKTIVAISRVAAKNYRPTGKTKIILDALDMDAYAAPVQPALRKELGLSSDRKIVGFMGRLVERKGVPVLMEAFARVAREIPSSILVVVGGNDPGSRVDLLDLYRKKARALGIEKSAFFVGFRRDPRPFTADFDVAVMPSTDPEPFGLVAPEAMALGIPTIVSDNSGAAEVLRDGIDGFLFKTRSAEDLSRVILALLKNETLRRRVGQEGRRKAFELFGSKNYGREMTQTILNAAGSAA